MPSCTPPSCELFSEEAASAPTHSGVSRASRQGHSQGNVWAAEKLLALRSPHAAHGAGGWTGRSVSELSLVLCWARVSRPRTGRGLGRPSTECWGQGRGQAAPSQLETRPCPRSPYSKATSTSAQGNPSDTRGPCTLQPKWEGEKADGAWWPLPICTSLPSSVVPGGPWVLPSAPLLPKPHSSSGL